MESAKVIAGLTRLVRDVALAEDLAQEALLAALEQWPATGVPANPGAWLTAIAKRRAIDFFRHDAVKSRRHEELGREIAALEQTPPDFALKLDEPIEDDLLRLMFISCHPVLATEARTALTLRLLGGLSTNEIARAFLVPEATVAQRIVRAKRTLTNKRIPFEIPGKQDLAARLSSVLEVIYLIFNEGYSATAGEDLVRPSLCEDALRLGRILAELSPQEAEVHGLIALMEIQASRLRARVDTFGKPVLLLDQDRSQWDGVLIRRGLAAIERAHQVHTTGGFYLLQAELAACHARARSSQETDWDEIVALYDQLAALTSSPVIELNRAVAVGMASGPSAGLALVDALVAEPSMQHYHLYFGVRGDFLFKLERYGRGLHNFRPGRSADP